MSGAPRLSSSPSQRNFDMLNMLARVWASAGVLLRCGAVLAMSAGQAGSHHSSRELVMHASADASDAIMSVLSAQLWSPPVQCGWFSGMHAHCEARQCGVTVSRMCAVVLQVAY